MQNVTQNLLPSVSTVLKKMSNCKAYEKAKYDKSILLRDKAINRTGTRKDENSIKVKITEYCVTGSSRKAGHHIK